MFDFWFLRKKVGFSLPLLTLLSVASSAPAQAATVNVRDYGARGDGVTDDTAAIQRAVNAVQGTGGTVYVPSGTYLINVGYNTMGGRSGIQITRAMTLELGSGATLKAKGSSLSDFYVLSILSASNVRVLGPGTILGERFTHTGSSSAWGGFNIGIRRSTNVTIDGVTVADAFGDGITIREYSSYTTIKNVMSKNNRRLGMSIISGNNLSILNSTFRGTWGKTPECGLDIEPDASFVVDRVLIQGNTFSVNDGCGVSVTLADRSGRVSNVTIDRNTISGNGRSDGIWMWGTGINVNYVSGTKITNNTITSNYGEGIMLGYKNGTDDRPARSTIVDGNTITYQKVTPNYPYRWSGGGVYLWSASYSVISNNIITDNAKNGVVGPLNGTNNGGDMTIGIRGNTVLRNGMTP